MADSKPGRRAAPTGPDFLADKVLILGGSTNPRFLPDFEAMEEYELWGINNCRPLWTDTYQFARWFNLHRWDHLYRDWRGGLEANCQWANANPEVPFYTLDEWFPSMIDAPPLPDRRPFPRQLGFPRDDYHASSFDLLVAFAIWAGTKEIRLHGIDMEQPHVEPISARACLEYWIGFAEASGVKVYAAEDCQLLAQYQLIKNNLVYGWDDVRIVTDQRPRNER